jgi:hypothetical protein
MDEDQLYPDLTILAGAQDEADANRQERKQSRNTWLTN